MTNATSHPEHTDLSNAAWFKASASSGSGGCIEVAFPDNDRVTIRDNDDPNNPPFVVTRHVFNCWVDGAKNGEFDAPA
ncbi:DUF397 domain-containing protein [Streptomyces gobiensis]|uniref:DUF397 domain-containing protein n=1 Tax=Streptomyces gobiensis TaxID=2875706 RepID=UPI001E3A1E96|nr:DUF397 domain-containing protein [Streptomyces gobiensis]UGY90285.1 DUF397 domain-containing protein [Streptomyces gobiensis]